MTAGLTHAHDSMLRRMSQQYYRTRTWAPATIAAQRAKKAFMVLRESYPRRFESREGKLAAEVLGKAGCLSFVRYLKIWPFYYILELPSHF